MMLALLRTIKDADHQPYVLLNNPGEVAGMIEAETPTAYIYARSYLSKFFPFPYIWNLIRCIRVIKSFDPDLIIVEGKILTQLLAIAARICRVKVFSYVHYPVSEYEARRMMYSLVDRIIVCARGLKDYFNVLDLPSNRFVGINNFVDVERFAPAEDTAQVRETQFGIEPSTFVIGLVGHLSVVKGQKVLTQAVKRLVDSGHSVQALLAGCDNDPDSKNEIELKTLVRQLNLEQNIQFLGKISDTRVVYQASDVLALPSLREGLPLVILEAMACGIPVVATAVDGIPDAVIDGKTGFLIETANVEMLVEKLIHLIQDRSLRITMGMRARERAQGVFSQNEYKRKFLELIQD